MVSEGSKADYAMYAGFLGWLVASLPVLKEALQILILVASLVSLCCAAWYHYKAAKKL